MKSTILLSSAIFSTSYACTTELWGQGTCDYPVLTEGGSGPPITSDIVSQLATCFTDKFGPGPYTIDGIPIPDAGGQGNAWGVYTTIDGNPFSMSVGNLCYCSQSMDADFVNDLSGTADTGEFLVVKVQCGVNSDACPAAGAPGDDGSTLPSGMYADVYSCPDNPCDMGDYQQAYEC